MKSRYSGDEIRESGGRRPAGRIAIALRARGPERRFFNDSESNSDASSDTISTDAKQTVGDQGVLVTDGGVVDQSQNDNRQFDDNSSLQIVTTDNSVDQNTVVDSRDLSDNSSFVSVVAPTTTTTTTTTTNVADNRDFSDKSSYSSSSSFADSSSKVYNTYAADADVLREVATGAFSAAELVTGQSAQLFESALNFGDAQSSRSQQALLATATQLGDLTKSSVALADRATSLVADNAKTADQQTAEKLIKGGTYVAVALALAFVASRYFKK